MDNTNCLVRFKCDKCGNEMYRQEYASDGLKPCPECGTYFMTQMTSSCNGWDFFRKNTVINY